MYSNCINKFALKAAGFVIVLNRNVYPDLYFNKFRKR